MWGVTVRCPTCDRDGADCPTWDTMIRGTLPNSDVRLIALAAMRDCRAHAVDWRARCLAAEDAATDFRLAARAEIDRLNVELHEAAAKFAALVELAVTWRRRVATLRAEAADDSRRDPTVAVAWLEWAAGEIETCHISPASLAAEATP